MLHMDASVIINLFCFPTEVNYFLYVINSRKKGSARLIRIFANWAALSSATWMVIAGTYALI
jgi:hypothetical protein